MVQAPPATPVEPSHPDGASLVAPPLAPPGVRRACLAILVVLTGLFAGTGAVAIWRQAADFEYFYKGSRWLMEHGTRDANYDLLPDGTRVARGGIEWYLPFVPRVFALISWLPLRAAGYVWLACNVLAFFATVRLLGRHLNGLPPQDWPVTTLIPVILTAFFWYWEFRLNQINTLTLLLLTASFVLWQRRRFGIAGFWLGLAALLKITPGLLIGWFMLKRQWRTAGAALATVLLAGPVSDALAFGPTYAGQWYAAWVRTTLVGSSSRALVLQQREMDWRNQSLAAVLSRWLSPTNYATHFDNDPRIRMNDPPATINLARLDRRQIAWIVTLVTAFSLLALAILARKPAAAQPLWQLRIEWALVLLAMLWLMPVMRRYHLILATPAVVVIAGAVHYLGRTSRTAVLAVGCTLVMLLLQLALLARALLDTHAVEAGGLMLAVVPALALPLVALHRRLGRAPHRLPRSIHDPNHPLSPVPAA